MAQGKKSVVLYCDLIHTIEKMDNETAGEFFKHYLRYINDLEPETNNLVVELTFESVKQNLKRDLKKWERRAENSRKNGTLGGRPKKNPEEPSGLIKNPEEPRKPVNGNVNVNVTVNDSDNVIKTIEDRKERFKESLTPHIFKYGKEMVDAFFNYWSEHNEKGKKMRFEMSKNQPFNFSRRLSTWKKNETKFNSSSDKDGRYIKKEISNYTWE